MEPDVSVLDFWPQSTLVLQEHIPAHPQFPVINLHTHIGAKVKKPPRQNERLLEAMASALGGDNPTTRDILRIMSASDTPIEQVVRVMDICNVEKCVDLDGLLPIAEHLELYREFRDRFILFKTLSLQEFGHPEYGRKQADQLAKAVDTGARGLKVHKSLGLTARDSCGKVIAVNNPKLDPVWAKAGELGVPVLIHVADPDCYFNPVDRYNPAYKKLSQRPERSYCGSGFPTKKEILAQRDEIIERHPDTIFIGAHHGNCPEDLAYIGALLDRSPNLYVEFSYALVQLGLQPHSARKHFIKYQDRILFGTDGIPDENRYRMYYRFLETEDDHFRCGNGAWEDFISGLNLPTEVLKKIYRLNALKIIPT